jgi:hypothetical protein
MRKVLLGFGWLMLAIAGIAHTQTPTKPFTITLEAETPQVKVGGQVILDVIMTNTSDHEIDCTMYYHSQIDQRYGYQVFYEDGTPAAKIDKRLSSDSFACVLDPGESSQSGGLISQIFDFSRPGKYTIQASRLVLGDDQRPDTLEMHKDPWIEIKSNTIDITVLPADDTPAAKPASRLPFSITLSTDKPVVNAGGDVLVDAVMTNISDHDVDCASNWSNALDRNYDYDVTREDGQPVPKIEKRFHGSFDAAPCIIKPGEAAHAAGGLVSVLYDFSRPGKYSIQVSRPVLGDGNRPGTVGTGATKGVAVRSNTLIVTVLPADDTPARQ